MRRACHILFAFALVAWPFGASAHVLDEYLQAALVRIEPDGLHLELNLTPGEAVANQVLDLIDNNHDGVISSNEAAAYCEALAHDLVVSLDGRELKLRQATFTFPEVSELRGGWGIIRVELTAGIGSLAGGEHHLTFENQHLPRFSVYLFNAAHPSSDAVTITRQNRNLNQSIGEIDYNFIAPPSRLKRIVYAADIILALGVVWKVMGSQTPGRARNPAPTPVAG